MIRLIARLIRRVQFRLAELEAEKQSTNPAALVRLICWLAEVPAEVTCGFLARGTGCAEVGRILAVAREYGGAEALQTASFLVPESAAVWSDSDREFLYELETAFKEKTQ